MPTEDRFQWRSATGCREGSRVVLLGARDVSHGWPLSREVDTGEVVAEFFEGVAGSRSRGVER